MREAYTVMSESGEHRRRAMWRGAWRPIAAAVLAVGLGTGAAAPALAAEPGLGVAPAIVRFHVVPHSDAVLDQQVKLRVRDRLLGEMEAIASEHGSWFGVPWGCHVHRLAAEAEAELAALGVPYGVRATWGPEPLSPRHRAELDLPGEEHPTLRIILGDGAGSNWWCVLFPPLCFMDASQLAFAAGKGREGNLEGNPDGPGRLEGADGTGAMEAEEGEGTVWRFGLWLWPFPDGVEEADSLWSRDTLRE